MQPCLRRLTKATYRLSFVGVLLIFVTLIQTTTAQEEKLSVPETKKSFKASFNKDDIVVRARQTKHKGERLNLETLVFKYNRFDKKQSRLLPVDVAVMNQGVAVLLYDPKLQKIALLEKVQSGIVYHPETPWALTLMTSRMTQEDHSGEDAAYRVVESHAGTNIAKMIYVQDVFPAPSMSSELMSLFVVLVDLEGEESEFIRKTSNNDNVKSHLFTIDEAKGLLESRKIKDAITLVGVQWLLLHQAQIDSDWRQANVESEPTQSESTESELIGSEPIASENAGEPSEKSAKSEQEPSAKPEQEPSPKSEQEAS
ncbi:MAG: hypothetical protein OXE99_00295 [Cellvibrionales bacterium]|nr:hypothetical protein [Cellvibrionales bacterium]